MTADEMPPEETDDGAERAAPATIPLPALDAFDRGSREYVEGKNEAAVAKFDEAVAVYPEFGSAHYMRGLTLLRLGRTDEAVAALKKAAETTDNSILRQYAEKKLESLAGAPAL